MKKQNKKVNCPPKIPCPPRPANRMPEPVRKWIPCSERLPKIDEDVLTCDESGFIAISSCNGGGEFSSYADDYYIGHRDKKPKVVAWMNLPEPPKMDGGSE